MTFGGVECGIIGAATAYESGIEWKSSGGRIFGVDYGMETDHASARVSVSGGMDSIRALKAGIEECVSERADFRFAEGELPFGPLYACCGDARLLIAESGDLKTIEKGCAEYEFTLAASGAELPFRHDSLPMDIGNFAVISASRENVPDSGHAMLIAGWSAHSHGWAARRLSLTLSGHCGKLGGTLRWLAERRARPFGLGCGDSMSLIDGQSAENLAFLAFGNLRRIGNSGLWEADLDFAEAAH